MKTTQLWMLAAVTLAAAGLSACGGGGSSGVADAVGKVPVSAMSSVQAFVQFVGAQAPDDRAEPLDVESAVPPVSDTDEPMDLS